ncbi:hypothetical protein KP509_04G014900 [Ceratopteris richardii]|uniref:Uncharacterized protein n=1 Tax=Ceratopteris richardii TaxID=49495 RepID=A0A8T2UUK7_CERRI|nr:hypothetical protein KP509_04G014900 [Ceratopteris richardii]
MHDDCQGNEKWQEKMTLSSRTSYIISQGGFISSISRSSLASIVWNWTRDDLHYALTTTIQRETYLK